MLLEKGDKLLLIGDSVTDVDRERPVGEGAGLGHGYPLFVDALLGSAHPDQKIRVVNMGISGNTARDLKARWQEDVLDLKPDWVSVMIGINDVWRQYDSPLKPESHVYLDEYEATLNELVEKTLPKVKGMVMMTPYYIESLREDAMRAKMDEYGAAVKRVADKHGTLFVDLQARFNELLTHTHSASIAWDRVHPNHVGHMAIARGLLGAFNAFE